jgi:ankyrin repeat protein
LTAYARAIFPEGDKDGSFNPVVYSFLQVEREINADASSTAKHLQSQGQFPDAAILLDSLLYMSNPSRFPFCECSDVLNLNNYIAILKKLGDHNSARILQERMVNGLVMGPHELRQTAFLELWELHEVLCESILVSIKRCLRRALDKGRLELYFWGSAEELEEDLGHLSADRMIPAIHQALVMGNKDMLLEALKRPDWIDAKDIFGSTALHCAAAVNNAELIGLLIDEGIDVDARDAASDWTLLHVAVSRGNFEVARVLTQNNADITARDDYERTPLHIAASKGHAKVVQALAQDGADLNARNFDEETPLHVAADGGYAEVTDILIHEGANVDACNTSWWTPLHNAAWKGQYGVADVLLRANARVNAQSLLDLTPLHLAAKEGHTILIDMLYKNGANIEARDCEDRTPLALAISEDQQHTATRLVHLGANIQEIQLWIGDWWDPKPSKFLAEGAFKIAKAIICEKYGLQAYREFFDPSISLGPDPISDCDSHTCIYRAA